MNPRLLTATLALGACAAFSAAAWAQAPAPARTPGAAPAAFTPSEGTEQKVAEPLVQRTVIEDRGNRIEELRVRGQLQRISVQPRSAAAYEIITPRDARVDDDDRTGSAGAVGKRVWPLFAF